MTASKATVTQQPNPRRFPLEATVRNVHSHLTGTVQRQNSREVIVKRPDGRYVAERPGDLELWEEPKSD